MNRYEAQEWSKSVCRMAHLRAHVRKAIDDAPPTRTPEFIPWFLDWQREAIRLFEREKWWSLDAAHHTDLDEAA